MQRDVWLEFVRECLKQADALLVISPTSTETSCSACTFKGLESEVLVHALVSHLEPNLFSGALVQRFNTLEVCRILYSFFS